MIKNIAIRAAALILIAFILRNVKNAILILFDLEKDINVASNIRKIHLVLVLGFTLLIFILYNRKTLSNLKIKKFSVPYFLKYLSASIVIFILYYVLYYFGNTTGLFYTKSGPILFLIGYILLAAFIALLAVSLFTYPFLKNVYEKYKHQWKYFIGIFILGFIAFTWFRDTWPLFSGIVLMILFLLFQATGYAVSVVGIDLKVNNFIIQIGEPCSGIDSFLLFTAFFASIFALEHKQLKKRRFIILSIIGLIGIFLVNILRLYLLILLGVHVSPELAVGLFHTNAGWVLFIAYFLLYYWLIKRYIYR